jgi:hypothetical protein
MSGKWRKNVVIGVLLFDLGLVAVRTGYLLVQGGNAQRPDLPKVLQEVSFDPCSARAQSAEKLTVTTVILLTAMTLM